MKLIKSRLAIGVGALTMGLLAGCAQSPDETAMMGSAQWLEAGRVAAEKGDWQGAQMSFANALRHDINNGYLQTLNGLAYDQLSSEDTAKAEFAEVAYENAELMAPGQYWPALMAGYLALQRNDPQGAVPHFLKAAQDEEAEWPAAYGLAVSAYYSGDLMLAEAATRECLRQQPDRAEVIRLSALVRAASGDEVALQDISRYAAAGGEPQDVLWLQKRVEQLLTGYRYDYADKPVKLAQYSGADGGRVAADTSDPGPGLFADSPPQISVDVTIILSSVAKNARRGINLLDSLSAVYSLDRTYSKTTVEQSGAGTGSSAVRTITRNIGIPQINYNLNLFNNSGQYYSVLARPSLTAYLQQTSDFFAGRTVNVSVSGINSGDILPIDVGVALTVTPEVITTENALIRVAANRSFLSNAEIGRFDESLTTFKQQVSAVADIKYGQTLILSALSETVKDQLYSKVPGVGDVPILSAITKETNTQEREESLLILVTPQRPNLVNLGNTGMRNAEVLRLMRYWEQLASPTSSFDDILRRLEQMPLYRQAQKADLSARLPEHKTLVENALKASYRLAATP